MKSKIMAIFTRTPLHVGAGTSVGAVDQPVIRERHTGFPIIPGSAIKGVLRDYAVSSSTLNTDVDKLFGFPGVPEKDDDTKEAKGSAGKLGFGEAKLLAFPLRSAKGSFVFAVCPLTLSRYARDASLNFDIPSVEDNHACANEIVTISGKLAVEEYVFKVKDVFPEYWANHLSNLLNDKVLQAGKEQFVLLSNNDFCYFALNACQVQHHNKIGEHGVVESGQLFNTETVPSETLFYSNIHFLCEDIIENSLLKYFEEEKILQFGGESTTGLGFSTVKIV